MNYYQEDRGFFEPAIHWAGEKDGRTVSECPIIYFSVAQLWKVFGVHEYIFRLVNLLIVFLGLFCLFRLIIGLTGNTYWSLAIVFLLFSSQILSYYSNNFLADAPAFGLSLTASFLFWKGGNQKKQALYYLSFLIFLLAGLIKISSLIIFIAFFAIQLYMLVFARKDKVWFNRWYNLFPYLLVMAILFAWYNFARKYNQQNISGIFLTDIFPIWSLDKETIKNIWLSFRTILLPAYFNKKALYLIIFLFFLQVFFYKKINKFLFYLNILVFAGVVAYILLFYQAFTVHDYYLTNLLIFIPLPLLSMLEMLNCHYPALLKNIWLKGLVLIGLIFLIYQTSVINRMKYSAKDWLVRKNFVVNRGTVAYNAEIQEDYAKHKQAYETITPYLRKLGIKRSDRVLSLPDESINISLYLMDQKGYSAFGYGSLPFDERMQSYRNNKVKYLIIDSVLTKQDFLQPYLSNMIGKYHNICIYDLRDTVKLDNLKTLNANIENGPADPL